jgi:tRNA(Arg) A34 adenosine deaminase TadA
MEMACLMAVESVNEGGGPFGAVLVQIDDETNEVIRYWKSHNRVTQLTDPTAHAEVMAIRSACRSLGIYDLGHIHKEESILSQPGSTSHCELFSSCEPCPMCYSALFWARIPVLYFAATRFDASAPGVGFSDKELYDELAIPYTERKTKVYQCECPTASEAFRLWEISDKKEY